MGGLTGAADVDEASKLRDEVFTFGGMFNVHADRTEKESVVYCGSGIDGIGLAHPQAEPGQQATGEGARQEAERSLARRRCGLFVRHGGDPSVTRLTPDPPQRQHQEAKPSASN